MSILLDKEPHVNKQPKNKVITIETAGLKSLFSKFKFTFSSGFSKNVDFVYDRCRT